MKKFFSFIAAVLFAGSMFAATAVMQYPGGTTTNMAGDGANNAATVGLDASLFTVLSDKGGHSQNVGLNKDGTIRLYAKEGNGNILSVSMTGGTIKNIIVKDSVNSKAKGVMQVKVGENVVTVSEGKYVVDAEAFAIQNIATTTTNNQIWINKLTIEYELDGSVVPAPTFAPEDGSFIGSVEVSLSCAVEDAKIYYTLDETDPSDTITVTEARALIDAAPSNTYVGAHLVKGVAAGKPYVTGSSGFKGNIILWLTDVENKKDSLEAYYIAGLNNELWESLEAAQAEIGEGDTVMICVTKMMLYNNKIYETASNTAYYAGMLGKYVEDPTIVYDTLTVAEAKAICDTLGTNTSSETKYYVEGYAVYADPYDALKKNQIFFMVDDPAKQDSLFEAYLATPMKEGVAYPVLSGDKVRVFGRLKKYIDSKTSRKQLEITDPTVEFLAEVEGDRTIVIPTIDTITVARALEIGKALTGSQLVTKEDYCIEGYVSHIQEPYTETYGNETFWITDTKGDRTMDKDVAFEVYHGKPSTGAEIGLQAKIRIVCKIKNYNGTIENDGQNITFEVLEQGVPEKIDTITVARAVEIGKALESGKETLDRYVITGYVSQIAELYHPDKKTELFWISDTKGSRAESSDDNAFYVFNGRPDNQQELGLDAQVRIMTTIKNYNGTIENNSAIDVEVLEKGSIEADTLSVKEALAKGKELSGKSAEFYVVEGYIASVSYKYDASNGNMSFYMHDKFDKTRGDFQCYRAKVAKKDTAYFKQGSYVRVLGRMENGSHGIQLTQGCRAFTAQAPKLDTTFVTVAEAVEIGNELAVGQETDIYYAVFGYFAYGSVEYDETAGTQTFGISDDEEYDMDTSLSLYAVNAMIASPGADYGDKVYVVGWISKSKDEDGEFISIENGNAYVNEIPQPTGFEQIEMTEKARKVLINGGIYIIRDKKMYNLQGARVK